MNKKILTISILAIFMLVTISFATAITTNTTDTQKRESPLFKIRTRLAIGERIKDLTTKFLKTRIFLPFQWLRNKIHTDSMASIVSPTCYGWPCTYEKTANPCTCGVKYCG